MKYILLLATILLIGGSVSAASSASTSISGNAQASATTNGTTITSSSDGDRVDADTYASGGGSASSQASNGTTTITSNSGDSAPESTEIVNQPLPITTQLSPTASQPASRAKKKQVASVEKPVKKSSEDVKPAPEVKKDDNKKIVQMPAEDQSNETIDSLSKRLKTLNQLVGSTIVILVIILLNQLVLTYLLHKKFRQEISLKV